MRVLLGFLLAIALATVAGVLFIYSSLYNVAATRGTTHWNVGS